MNDIRLVKLKSGEELIGDVTVIGDDVINLRSGTRLYNVQRQYFQTSEVTVSNTYYKEFLPTIPSGYKILPERTKPPSSATCS